MYERAIEMSEPVETLDGWYALHDFRKIDWKAWKKQVDPTERKQIIDELFEWTSAFSKVEEERQGSYGQYSIIGHKADLLFIHLRPTVTELSELEVQFNKLRLADYLTAPYSYFSVVELSAYLAKGDADPETNPYLQKRLKPVLPKTDHVCFYPMNKKREGNDNWFMLPMKERQRMMKSHGMIGRSYAGKVTQMITGSVGLDDWEWGVTLHADDPLQFKKLIYEMRFDEVSARYADFGSFLVGNRLTNSDLSDLLTP